MKMLVKDYDKTALRNFVKDTISGKIKTLEFYLNFTLEATREVKKTSKYDSIREEMQEDGLVKISKNTVKITEKGRVFTRNVAMAFDLRMMRKMPETRLFSMTV